MDRDAYAVGMKRKWIAFLLLHVLVAATSFAKDKKADWDVIKKLPPGTHLFIEVRGGNECSLQRVTDGQLFCSREYPGSYYKGPREYGDQVFNRVDIHFFCDSRVETCTDNNYYLCVGEMDPCRAYDYSSGTPSLLAAAGGGGGWRSGDQPNAFAGVKIGLGGPTMDLQYDRLNAQNGFSLEGSWMMPVFRVPRWRPKDDRLCLRVYAEPGVGYRAGGGPFGGYSSAKVLALIGDKWMNDGVSPYIEFQRRFPFNSPLDGDNRIAAGLMWAVCEHCGLD
jgi:hypothetical protein